MNSVIYRETCGNRQSDANRSVILRKKQHEAANLIAVHSSYGCSVRHADPRPDDREGLIKKDTVSLAPPMSRKDHFWGATNRQSTGYARMGGRSGSAGSDKSGMTQIPAARKRTALRDLAWGMQ
ncbi:MAG: hypothetical protein V4793_33585 [Paraburkholderia tropica]|uniref:hypothetical protein n=1 Tax=Paraburkholderia tropica TaxID=92647 RepID=UPI0011B37486|nr:hypothetical protein [Paraburkholderia tropica]MDE1143588.1 hypothetical protein [Paraburkholderia tropica]